LEDPRGNLTLEFLRVVSLTNPKYVLWENVPGVLADKTQAFNILITGLSELGYSVDHQILDAQEFGLPQKRSRVFLVCEKINACFSPHTAFETLNKILLLTLSDMGKKYHNKTSVLKEITLSPLPQMLMLLNNALSSKLPTYQIELKNNMILSKKDFYPIINQMVFLLFNEANDISVSIDKKAMDVHERLISLLTMTFDYYQVKDIDTYSPTLEEVTPLWRFKHNLLTNFLENLTVFLNYVESREKSSLFQNLLNTDSLFYILKEETEIFNKRFSKKKLNVEKDKNKGETI
jgi:site-specific DNA-cytosine methylase